MIAVIQQHSVCNLLISEEQECHSQLQQFEGGSDLCTRVNYWTWTQCWRHATYGLEIPCDGR